jgi:hypothetical protein
MSLAFSVAAAQQIIYCTLVVFFIFSMLHT